MQGVWLKLYQRVGFGGWGLCCVRVCFIGGGAYTVRVVSYLHHVLVGTYTVSGLVSKGVGLSGLVSQGGWFHNGWGLSIFITRGWVVSVPDCHRGGSDTLRAIFKDFADAAKIILSSDILSCLTCSNSNLDPCVSYRCI